MTETIAPDYSTLLVSQWSETLNLIDKIFQVPTALVMKLERDKIKVFAKNDDPANPYQINDCETFDGSGLYCEHVIKNQQMLEVNNALTDTNWATNPDIKLNMIYYLGLPLSNSDGSPFGTICVLDSKEQATKQEYKALLMHIRSSMEQQLQAYEMQQRLFEKKNLKHIENLICVMAHELNTPTGVAITAMSVLTNQVKTLKTQFKNQALAKSHFIHFFEQTEQCLDLLNTNLNKSSGLIDRFRDISNQLSYRKIPVKLHQLITDMDKSFQRSHQGLVKVNNRLEQNIVVNTIPMLIQSVIAQLVDNAVEHAFKSDSPTNQVTVTVDTAANDIIFEVQDNGVGFSSQAFEDVFSPSIGHDNQPHNQQSHIGLGLCIVKKVVLMHLQGTIKLKPCSQGSLFEIRLPK